MKIRQYQERHIALSGRGEQGMAVIVVIALFAIMMLFMGMSLHSLNFLRQDLKIIERQQLQRIRQMSAVTNAELTTKPLILAQSNATNSSSTFHQP
jgi:hypothetical protein